MKTAKYKDYFERMFESKQEAEKAKVAMGNVLSPFIDAKSEGVEILEVSKLEWTYLATWFEKNLPWDWDGKKIWNIVLKKIK